MDLEKEQSCSISVDLQECRLPVSNINEKFNHQRLMLTQDHAECIRSAELRNVHVVDASTETDKFVVTDKPANYQRVVENSE